jgi:hypothetical protein
MHTKDILAEALETAGLHRLAVKAARGHYHDFLSPLAFPELQLICELEHAHTAAATLLIGRVENGEFDASLEESNEWMRTEGLEVFKDNKLH